MEKLLTEKKCVDKRIYEKFKSQEMHIPDFWNMEQWMTSEIRDIHGGIHSWQRGNEKGYLYNEITGYGIKLYTYLYDTFEDPKYLQMAKQSASYIDSQVNGSCGGMSRGGIYYVFDTTICLSGILSYYDYVVNNKRMDNGHIDKNGIKKLLNFSYYNLLKKTPIELNGSSKVGLDLNHWSLSYGSHLLKCCMALSQSSNIFKDEKEKLDDMIDVLCLDVLYNFHDGHFHTNSNSKDVYTHSHCYATEGLIYLNRPEYLCIIEESANWLATVQNPDGSLYNRYFSDKHQEEVADITAQAIRIWIWTNKDKFDCNIRKAFSFLKSLQSPEGGIYYQPGSKDVNSWVTMFTMNAVMWYHNGANTKWLV
jgi:hypothetical protein